MKPLVIYHDNCADGFGAAFAAWLKLGDEAEYLPMQYGAAKNWDSFIDILPPNTAYVGQAEIYILDFSLPKDVMDTLFEVAKRVVWLDHHKTAFEVWCKEYYPGKLYTQPLVDTASSRADNNDFRHTIILNDNKSGAMIAWEYFHQDKEVPMLIKHIDDYDRWQFKIVGTKEFNKALWSYAPWSFGQWRDINLCVEEIYLAVSESIADKHEYGRMLIEGAAILRAHDQNVQAVVKGASRSCSLGRTLGYEYEFKTEEWQDNLDGLAANCPPNLASDVGHQLAKQSGTYGLLWYINKEGKCLCSLRSNGEYDVSAIAKAFGGGGHRNAAGFEVDVQTLLGWIK